MGLGFVAGEGSAGTGPGFVAGGKTRPDIPFRKYHWSTVVG
jgi:hypothetical protein